MNSSYYKYKRQDLARFLPKQYSRILEIGCGEGEFRGNVTQRCEYWGVEPFAPAADVALTRLDKVLVGTYQEMLVQLPNNYFDLVICNDVIEHMVDHDAFFQTIKTNLTNHGYLVGSIPNVRYLSNLYNLLILKEWLYTDLGILDKTHLRFFTEKSLKRTFQENGFFIEDFGGINPYWARSLSARGLLAVLIFGQDVNYMQFGFRIIKHT